MTADRDDDTPIPPPGKALISLSLDTFNMNTRGTIRSLGYPDRDVLMAFRLHDGHLDTMVVDAVSGRSVHGVEGIAGLIERWVADLTGELVDVTTDPDFHVHFLDADDPGPEDIKPFSQPAKKVH